MDSFDSFPRPQSADGPATILAIGTANPANVMDQMEYADYYFRITNAEDKTELKRKFKRICEKSTIKKRHMSLTEEILKKNPSLCEYMAPSFDARQQIVLEEVPRLAKEAAAKAIKEWGRPTSDITHLPVNMASLHAMRKAQRARGPATIMAIGTANPPNLYEQSTYPDYYFRVTNSEHMQELKHKFQRICEKTMVKRRYLYLTEEILKERPKLCSYMEPSFDDRQDIVVEEVPKLAKEAATKAIKEWGRSMSDITHLVFCSISGIDMPGADYRLAKLLGLPLSVNRIMLYSQACHMGAAMLRIAKDLAENNKGARVLVVSCEITVLSFRGPDEHDFQALAGQAGFGDGAAAVIVGADPIQGVEKSIYEIVSATQVTVPESEKAVGGHLREVGLTFYFFSQLPMIIADNIENSLTEAFKPLGITNWNDIFWVAHPGNWAIMDAIERRLGLQPEKLSTARHVFSEYGNMQSATVYFVLDEVRKRSVTQGQSTTGDGLRWGVLFGFGPGLSIETVVLRGMVSIDAFRKAQRPQGPATIMAIGTANPPNLYEQSTFPDFYFRVTNSDHMPELKDKFRRICGKTMIKKRYIDLTEEVLKQKPGMCSYMDPSFDERQEIVVEEVPRLAKEAAAKAIKEWGRDKSEITHLVFCSTSGIDMPGADYRLVKLLGLPLSNPIFEMMSAAQVTVPDCEKAVGGHLKEIGLTFHFMNQLPMLISNNLENCLLEAFKPLGITDWNEVFWVSHPGNWGIMDAIEKKVGLKQEKLRSSRHVFGEYGNMMSATVLFVMDDVRKRSAAEGRATTGDGLEWGVLFGFGPGLTIETV
ncbi:hypothetical protein MUK42_14841, partial [Musa troglodytarum]